MCSTNDTQEVKDVTCLDNLDNFSLYIGFLDKPFLRNTMISRPKACF